MKPYDPQSQSLQPLLSTIIRRFPSFQIDLRNSESGEESRKSAWRLERGEKQLHSTPRVPIRTLTHNDELLIRGPLKRGGGEGASIRISDKRPLHWRAANSCKDSGNSPFNREENRIAHKHGYLQWHENGVQPRTTCFLRKYFALEHSQSANTAWGQPSGSRNIEVEVEIRIGMEKQGNLTATTRYLYRSGTPPTEYGWRGKVSLPVLTGHSLRFMLLQVIFAYTQTLERKVNRLENYIWSKDSSVEEARRSKRIYSPRTHEVLTSPLM
ncbi:hypothetical protein BOTNAR_0004g00440 [Botryotinia narcissicola]|uniref:Uncharacterized protein n=1 Tax=Botryotinia narcissicola TaxID=278944 RepID=A0A4Z1JMA8_9HELO|nr:hypothetical protein BOTNAR_0004g00440 [Botryotinia narcissicola]